MNEKTHKYWMIGLGIVFVVSVVLAWLASDGYYAAHTPIDFPRGKLEIQHADGTKTPFTIEIATTNEQQERGLMFRTELASDSGMLFLWTEDRPISMWMKNTEIPLDMLFVAHDGRIAGIVANAVPEDLTSLTVPVPVRAVIEIGGGEAERQNIRLGDRVFTPAFISQ